MTAKELYDKAIALPEERLVVDRRFVETGRLRIRTEIEEEYASIEEHLRREDIHVERVEINRDVDRVPEVREDGDVLIVPVVEEYLFVEKRLRLREELHVRRASSTEHMTDTIPVRRTRAVVERLGPGGNGQQTETIMTRTITALYDNRADAETARNQLTAAGVEASAISITSQSDSPTSSGATPSRGFFGALKDMFMPEEDRHAYSEGLRRGGCLLSARVDESQADEVVDLLDRSGAVDFDARQAQWRQSGWASSPPTDRTQDEETIPVVEEQLRVGKREIERGGVRVRSYIEEVPVREQVDLRQEHVEIERKPVDRRVSGADADRLFREQTIELSERGEEAVVGKEAVVREEIGLRKDVDTRTETIEDTVRRTEVDVDDSRSATPGQGRDTRRGVPAEPASFAGSDDEDEHSIAMDPKGTRVGETEEERRVRLEHERGSRPSRF